jgi:hypothetical protein
VKVGDREGTPDIHTQSDDKFVETKPEQVSNTARPAEVKVLIKDANSSKEVRHTREHH